MTAFFAGMTGLTLVVFMVFSVVVYFLPLVIAFYRKHPQILAIGLLNLFGGWTVLGWVGALVWSATAIQKPANTVNG